MTIEQYLDNFNKQFKLGNATEPTFRGDLQQLLESLAQGRTPNLIPEIIKQIADKLGLTFVPEKFPSTPCPSFQRRGKGWLQTNQQPKGLLQINLPILNLQKQKNLQN